MLAHITMNNERHHFVQAFLKLDHRRFDALGQIIYRIHAALHFIPQLPRIVPARHLHLDARAALAGGALDFLDAGQVGDDILERDDDGFLHLFRRSTAIGHADFHLVRREIGEHLHRQAVHDAVDAHQNDEHHQQVGRHTVAGKPFDQPIHFRLGLPFPPLPRLSLLPLGFPFKGPGDASPSMRTFSG